MKLIWHIFLKDLRRLALPLVAWAALYVAQYLAWVALPEGHDLTNRAAQFGPLLWGLQLLVGWLLVPRLIQDDSLVSDRAAWRTRPISGARLLGAKLLGLALMFWLWPSVATLPWWLEFGFGTGEILYAVAVNMLGMALLTGAATLVAVLTPDFARFVAWSLVLALGAGVSLMIIVAGLSSAGGSGVPASVLSTRASLITAVLVAAVVVVVPLQFLRRRRGLVHAGVAIAALAAVIVVNVWPWSTATLLAKTGLKAFTLPEAVGRLAHSTLVLPPDPSRQMAILQAETALTVSGLKPGEFTEWSGAEPALRIAGSPRSVLIAAQENRREWSSAYESLVGNRTERHVSEFATDWSLTVPGQVGPQLRSGNAALGVSHDGTLWRGERGPEVALRAGAGGARGLRQLHVQQVGRVDIDGYWRTNNDVAWIQTEPLFVPATVLELLSSGGENRLRSIQALFVNGDKWVVDGSPDLRHVKMDFHPRAMIPVGLIGVNALASSTSSPRSYDYTSVSKAGFPPEGTTLTSLIFEDVASLAVKVEAAPLAPDLVVESNLADALRRARAENKLVLALVREGAFDPHNRVDGIMWNGGPVADLVRARFVPVQLFQGGDGRFTRRYPRETFPQLAVITPENEVRDRFGLLEGEALLTALGANVAGRTYADALRDRLEVSAVTREAWSQRYRLAEDLLLRGDFEAAMEQFYWLIGRPNWASKWDIYWWRDWGFQQFAVGYRPAKEVFQAWREKALVDLQRNPADEVAARVLFVVGLSQRNDEAAWRNLARAVPRTNPVWWDFTSQWFQRSLEGKRPNYRAAIEAVDVEKLWTAGRSWARETLARNRTEETADYAEQLALVRWRVVSVGISGVRALAGAGEMERARALALEVDRMGGRENRFRLSQALREAGAAKLANELFDERSTRLGK